MESETAAPAASAGAPSGSAASAGAAGVPGPGLSAGLGDAKQAITMLNDRVLVQVPQAEGERRSRAGILIPATAKVARRLSWADVVAVGPHVRTIKAGDKVLFNPEECFEVEMHGDEYLILRERDLHAVAAARLDSGTGLYL